MDLATVPSTLSLDSSQASGILVPQSNESITDVPSFLQKFHTTVVVRLNKNKVSLPFNANLGFVRPQTSPDQQVFQDAADHTADLLASSSWLQFVQNNDFCFPPPQDAFNAKCFSPTQNGSNSTHGSHSHTEGTHSPTSTSRESHAQTVEMGRAGLDSSILFPFLSEPDWDHPNAMPPPEGAYLDSYSDQYFDQLVTA